MTKGTDPREVEVINRFKGIVKQHGRGVVPRQVLCYVDESGYEHHALVMGRTREFLRVRRGEELPEWLLVLRACVEVGYVYDVSVEPQRFYPPVKGWIKVDTNPWVWWSRKCAHAGLNTNQGFNYNKGTRGDSFLYVEIAGMRSWRWWRELVSEFEHQVRAALLGRGGIYGIGERKDAR